MFTEEYKGINSFLVGASNLLREYGVKRETRGSVCYELPEPFYFKITEPTATIITIPCRKWNKTLPYAESLWIAAGRNDLNYITYYLERMRDFSDDKIYARGAYGPRIRHFNGAMIDYKVAEALDANNIGIDQLRYIAECFREESSTRRAIISLGDVMKDNFNIEGGLKKTLDIPCTREVHFIKQSSSNKLDIIVKMRSNDMIWGASAVNIFNYTFMQEYMAAILGLEVGNYYHFADNFHYYDRHKEMVEQLSKVKKVVDEPYIYNKTFRNLEDFDNLVKELCSEEKKMRLDKSYSYREVSDPFFRDWYNMLYLYKRNAKVEFANPTLKKLYNSI